MQIPDLVQSLNYVIKSYHGAKKTYTLMGIAHWGCKNPSALIYCSTSREIRTPHPSDQTEDATNWIIQKPNAPL